MNHVRLNIQTIRWLDEADPDPSDQCAHGNVEFCVNDVGVVSPDSGPWNLTMAGLYLLRTITENNTATDSVCESNFMFPCCGHSPWLVGEGKYRLVCMGCNQGITFDIEHAGDSMRLSLASGQVQLVPTSEWRVAVLNYARQVERWYEASSPRIEPAEEKLFRPGWAAFWQEWRERILQAEHAA